MDGDVERERERLRNEWRKLCASRGCDVWALICQLLNFAATEHPDEFRRRRDSLAQTLFAPTWSDTTAIAISNSITTTNIDNNANTKAAAAAAVSADPSAAPGSNQGSPEKLASAGASARGAAATASSGAVSRAASQARRKGKDDEYNPDEPGLAAVGFARGSGIGARSSHPHPHPHRQAVDDAYDPTEPGFSPNRRLCRQGACVPDGRRPGADGHRSSFDGHRVATDVGRPGREAATGEQAVLATGVGKDRDVHTHTALGRGDGQESLSQDSGRVAGGVVDGSCSQTASPLRARLGGRNGQAGGSGDCLAGGRDWQAGGSRDAGSRSKHRDGGNQSGLRRPKQQMARASPEEQSDEREEDERREDVEVVDIEDEEEDEGRQEREAEGASEMVEGEMGLRHDGGEDGGGGVGRRGEEEEDGEEEEEEVRPEDEVEAWADEMESEERVLRVVQATKKTLGNPALGESAIMAELRLLEKLPISLDVLRMTQVGKVVKSLGKKHKSLPVQKLAHKLVREWKRVVMDCCTVAAASAAAVRKDRPYPHAPTAEGAVGLSREGEEAEEWRERADASAMDHCEEEEEDDGTLAAPPLDEKVFQLSALELSNCFTDLESMESELSGSVGSANGQLPTNGGLPHGASKAAAQPGATPPYPESSPSETSEPAGRRDALDPHHHAHHHHHHRQKEQRGHVSGRQSVLSSRVIKSGWEVNEEAAAAAAAAAAPSTAAAGPAPVQGREGRKSGQTGGGGGGGGDFQRHKVSPLPPRAEGVSRRHGVPTNESVPDGTMANGMRRCSGSGQMAKQGREQTASPFKVETKMRPQVVDDRLAEAKRKLTERYNGLEEAKKARTIQVLDVGPAKGPVKPKFKAKPAHPFGAAGQRLSLGQQARR